MFHALNADAEYENLSIDSIIIRVHQHGTGAKRALNNESNQHTGKSRGGNTTKIHAVIDGLRNPIYFQFLKGNINDNVFAMDILSHVNLEGANVLGDKAYGTSAVRNYITGKSPPKEYIKAMVL